MHQSLQYSKQPICENMHFASSTSCSHKPPPKGFPVRIRPANSVAMLPIVRFSLSFLRLAAQASFFLEAQRVLLRLVRPTHRNHLAYAERHVLRNVSNPIRHRWIPDGCGNLIHVLELPGLDSNKSRPPIILLHGHSMSAAFWFRNFDDLVKLGYRIYAVDMLGWGRSQRPRFKGKTAEDSVEWYMGSLEGLVKNLGINSFTLMGHSLGAYMSMEFTKRAPQRVNQLVLVSPAAAVRKVPVARALYFSIPPQNIVRRGGLLGFLLFVVNYPRNDKYTRDRLRDYTYHLATQGPPSGERAVLPIIKLLGPRRAECVRPLVENLKLFKTPVQIVVGETDSSMPVEGVHELYREMKRQGFKVDISVIEGADHCPMLEQPEEFGYILANLSKGKEWRNVESVASNNRKSRIRSVIDSAIP